MEAVLKKLEEINSNLKKIASNQNVPTLLKTKDIVELYHVSRNRATELCKKYGTNFGGWSIEAGKLEEVLRTAGRDILN